MSKDFDRQMRHCLPADTGDVIVARMLGTCTPAPAKEEDVEDGTATLPDGYHAIVDGGWGDLPCRAIRRAVGLLDTGAVLGRPRGRNGTAGR